MTSPAESAQDNLPDHESREIGWWSLKAIFLAVLAIATIPAALMLAKSTYQTYAAKTEAMAADARQVAEFVIAETERTLRFTYYRLDQFARRPAIRSMAMDPCDSLFSDLPDWGPLYANLSLVRRDGQAICNANGLRPMPHYGSRVWLKQALLSKSITIGGPSVSLSTGLWIVPVVRPLLDDKNEVIGSLSLTLDLARLKPTLPNVGLPEGSHVAILDSNGVYIANSEPIAASTWTGRPFPNSDVVAALATNSNERVKTIWFHDVAQNDHVAAIAPVPGTTWSVVAILPVQSLVSYAQESALLDFGLFGILLAISGALIGLVMMKAGRPIRSLAAAAKAQISGDRTSRADPHGPEELAAVAAEFNRMLDAQQLAADQLEQTERELRRKNELISATLDNMAQGVTLVESTGEIGLMNPRYLEMYGLKDSKLSQVGYPFRDLVHHLIEIGTVQDDADRYCAEVEAAMASRVATTRVVQLRDGRVISINIRPLPNGGWVSTHEDITAKHLLESEKENNRQFVKSIIDNIPAAVIVQTVNERRIVYMNRFAEGLWPQSAPTLGRCLADLLPPQLAERYGILDNEALQSSNVVHSNRVEMADGTVRSLISRHQVVRNQAGAPEFLMILVEDVTSLERLQAESDRNRVILDKVIEEAPWPLMLKSAEDSKILMVNRAAVTHFLRDRSTLVGRTAADIVSPQIAATVAEIDRKAIGQIGVPVVADHEVIGADGTRRFEQSRRVCIADSAGRPEYILVFIENMTERRLNEDRLRHAQKMEALGRLTGGIAHDFNNLLTVIIGNLDLLREEVGAQSNLARQLEVVLNESLRAQELIRRMLAFSRKQPLRPDVLDLNKLVDHTAKLLHRTLGETIKLKVTQSPSACPVLIDHAQLESCLINMALNSRDAMPKGGVLSIGTCVKVLDERETATRPGLSPGQHVVLSVSDTGNGIAAEAIPHIFEPFFTTKAAGKGTGLGLSMVYGFVKQSDGYIGVESTSGQGTTFELYFPLASQLPVAQETAPPLVPDEQEPASPAKTILVVDDQPRVRATVVQQLKSLGHNVLEAADGRSALDLLATGVDVELVFTDIVMPGGMNGFELVRFARESRPGLKVVFTSGYPGQQWTEECGKDALLSKPYRRQQLKQTIADALA